MQAQLQRLQKTPNELQKRRKNMPRGLKPVDFVQLIGTAKAVPFQNSCFSWFISFMRLPDPIFATKRLPKAAVHIHVTRGRVCRHIPLTLCGLIWSIEVVSGQNLSTYNFDPCARSACAIRHPDPAMPWPAHDGRAAEARCLD